MSRVLRAEDAFQLELEGASTHDSGNGLMETAALLRAIGSEIQAPAGLRARRGALLARGHRSGAPVRPGGAWRQARAVVLAAALTLLMVVGVGAATLGSRWLGESRTDEGPDVRIVLPDPEPLDHPESGPPLPSPSPAAPERDEEDFPEVEERDSPEVDEDDAAESDSIDADEGDDFELEEDDASRSEVSDSAEVDEAESTDPGASDPPDSGDAIGEDDAASESDSESDDGTAADRASAD